MKQILFAIVFLTLSTAAQAVTLQCHTTGADGETPRLSLAGQVSDEFAQGEEAGLDEVQDLVVTVGGKTTALGTLKIDPAYKPRIENRVRFNTINIPTGGGSDGFDGIIHGFIFPKMISSENFKAIVISSDDSYHDGIWSYYSMACHVSY